MARKGWVARGQCRDVVVFVGLDTSLCFVGAMLASCNELEGHFTIVDDLFEVLTGFVVHAKELGVDVPTKEEIKTIVVPFGDVGSLPVLDDLSMQVLGFIAVHDDEIVSPT